MAAHCSRFGAPGSGFAFSRAMRQLLTLALLLFSTPAFAQLKPDTDFLRGPTNQILFTAAGSIAGNGGTFFRSDISLFNYRDVAQNVRFLFLKQGQDGNTTLVQFRTLNARTGIVSEDFIREVLNESGLGALLITAVTAAGDIDTGGLLYATQRIWTPQPGSTGTTSQTFPAIPAGALNAASSVTILGQRLDSRYRTNVGIVNLDPTAPRTFDILQNTDDPTLAPGFAPVQTTVTVQPLSFSQVSLPNFRSMSLQIVVTPRTPINPQTWAAYGSSVDNVTGDSWSQLAFPLLGQ